MTVESDLLVALEVLTDGLVGLTRLRSELVAETAPVANQLRDKARPWTHGRGIQGVGIGRKLTKETELKQLAFRVYVDRKKPLSKLECRVPKWVPVPNLGKLPTDVIEIGRVQTEVFRRKVRPAMPGCGLSHRKVSVGTFGCLVRRKGKRGLYVLSNSHVLADSGLAKKGDLILQPAKSDGGRRPGDRLGRLHAFKPFQFSSTGYPNLMDAAIARVLKSRVKDDIRQLGHAPTGVGRVIRRGMEVRKVGRTTGYTVGVVSDCHYRMQLRYKKPGGGKGRVGFRDQVLCTRFTADGDSGSAVLNKTGRIIGLHFAGSASTSIFNRISHVFEAFDLELA